MNYVEATNKFFDKIRTDKDIVDLFVAWRKARIEMVNRDLVQSSNESKGLKETLVGQISICMEDIDAAEAALNVKGGNANPSENGGIPQW